MKDHLNIYSVNPFSLVFNKINGYIEESNGNKYLIFPFTDKNKEVLTKYTGLWNKIKSLIKTTDDKPGEYGKDFMKIKFDPDDNLPLNKRLKI